MWNVLPTVSLKHQRHIAILIDVCTSRNDAAYSDGLGGNNAGDSAMDHIVDTMWFVYGYKYVDRVP